MPDRRRILIIVTNANQYEKVGFRTGLWLSELTHFWDVVERAGHRMDIASPSGGFVPIDPESLIFTELAHSVGLGGKVSEHYQDRAYMDLLNDTVSVADVSADDYDVIYMTGGHGVMFDFRSSTLAKLTADFWEGGKIVSAVCHGPCGLLDVKLSDGTYLLDGKDVTGFSWAEEELAKRDEAVPYSLENEMRRRGAKYSKAKVPFASYVREDGRLITGQNPSSAHAVGEAVVKMLKEQTSYANRESAEA